jgi:hypothetical protein
MLPLRYKLREELQITDHIREVINLQGQQQKDSANSHQVTRLCLSSLHCNHVLKLTRIIDLILSITVYLHPDSIMYVSS